MSRMPSELGPEDIYRSCDASSFDFTTTEELSKVTEVIGQARAVSAVEFGMGVGSDGYNIFAVGPTGTGKSTTVNDFLARAAAELPTPDDWVYVHNFERPYEPRAICMPSGKAVQFRKEMEKLVEDLQAAISQAFESEEYEQKKRSIAEQVSGIQEEKLSALNKKAGEHGLTMVPTPAGPAFLPKGDDGEPLTRDQFYSLPEEEQKRYEESRTELEKELQQTMRAVRADEREGRESVDELDREVTTFAAEHLVDEMCERWCEVADVLEYLHAVLADVVENADDFKKTDSEAPPTMMGMPIPSQMRSEGVFRRYKINVLVDHSAQKGAPVVTESNPVMQHLVGRVEHLAQFGALITDFNMIKAGALHRANGGFLVLEAYEVLTKPYSWDALKRTLKTGVIRIEDAAQQLGFATTASLDPGPIPFEAKIVLIGEPFLYYLLYMRDPDFRELFKVKADFGTDTDRTPETEDLYARFIGRVCQERSLPPFAPDAVARVIEHSSRLVGDQRKLTTRFVNIADLIMESAYWARSSQPGEEKPVVRREHVQKAIEHHIYRSNLIEERVHEMITDRTIMVDTSGAVAGQANGLSVASIGDYSFGRPSRITATHHLGKGEVIDIEREVDMGGPIHSKGVMILAGYLASKYTGDRPLSLSARLVFEQSYSGVEGDSASSTELYTLLSSLSGVSIQQRFAVTGSVNQLGQVQAIGGVNEKIEGFFSVCKALGLNGDEGVLVPAANVRHLMLNEEVRTAVKEGRFHIWPVSTIDEGIEILTGVPAGELNEEGEYPEGSINRLVVDRLTLLAEKAREAKKKEGAEEEDDKTEK